MSIAAIIAASGSGTRLGGNIPKQFQLLGNKPVLAHTLGVFNRLDIIDDIIVAVPADYTAHTQDIIFRYNFNKTHTIVPGGANRAVSVYAALKKLPPTTNIVLIHDGVRPFVSEALIHAVAKSASTHGAAIPGTPLTDTIKEVDATGLVTATPDRRRFWRVQTPQGFTHELIMKAYAQGERDDILAHATDDSMLVERLGIPVHMVEGDSSNIKITTREDLALSEALLPMKGD